MRPSSDPGCRPRVAHDDRDRGSATRGPAQSSVARPTLTGGLTELAWVGAHVLMYPLGTRGATPPARPPPPARESSRRPSGPCSPTIPWAARTPVVLVHGLVDNRSVFSVVMNPQPAAPGVRPRVQLELQSASARHRARCRRPRRAHREHLRADRVRPRARRRPQPRRADLPLLRPAPGWRPPGRVPRHAAPPHQGSVWANVLPTSLIRQLRPGSPVLQELAEPAPGCRTRVTAVYSDLDQMVLPTSSGRCDHPDLSPPATCSSAGSDTCPCPATAASSTRWRRHLPAVATVRACRRPPPRPPDPSDSLSSGAGSRTFRPAVRSARSRSQIAHIATRRCSVLGRALTHRYGSITAPVATGGHPPLRTVLSRRRSPDGTPRRGPRGSARPGKVRLVSQQCTAGPRAAPARDRPARPSPCPASPRPGQRPRPVPRLPAADDVEAGRPTRQHSPATAGRPPAAAPRPDGAPRSGSRPSSPAPCWQRHPASSASPRRPGRDRLRLRPRHGATSRFTRRDRRRRRPRGASPRPRPRPGSASSPPPAPRGHPRPSCPPRAG